MSSEYIEPHEIRFLWSFWGSDRGNKTIQLVCAGPEVQLALLSLSESEEVGGMHRGGLKWNYLR
jgi:hypothetical protein